MFALEVLRKPVGLIAMLEWPHKKLWPAHQDTLGNYGLKLCTPGVHPTSAQQHHDELAESPVLCMHDLGRTCIAFSMHFNA